MRSLLENVERMIYESPAAAAEATIEAAEIAAKKKAAELVKNTVAGIIATGAGSLIGSSASDLERDLKLKQLRIANDLKTSDTNFRSGVAGAAAGVVGGLGIGAIGKAVYSKPKQQSIDENNTLATLGHLALAGGGAAAGYSSGDFFNNYEINREMALNELNRYNSNVGIGLKSAAAGAAGAIGLGLINRQLTRNLRPYQNKITQ